MTRSTQNVEEFRVIQNFYGGHNLGEREREGEREHMVSACRMRRLRHRRFEPIKFQNKSSDTYHGRSHVPSTVTLRIASPSVILLGCCSVLKLSAATVGAWETEKQIKFGNSVVVACRLIYSNRLSEMTSRCPVRFDAALLSVVNFMLLIGQAELKFGTLIIRVTRHFDQINWLSQMHNENIRHCLVRLGVPQPSQNETESTHRPLWRSLYLRHTYTHTVNIRSDK